MRFSGTKDIKQFVKGFLYAKSEQLKGKRVIDIPAGSGYTTQILQEIGARPEAYDLFPGFFKLVDIQCQFADLAQQLPIKDSYADYIICQEGIEHLPDQMHMFREFNRILKNGAALLITTPNYSNLRGKLSYLLTESEYFGKIIAPNELDSIWLSDQHSRDIYFGHVFLTGVQKMRMLAKMAGFRIKEVHYFRVNGTSLFLLPFFYPFIWLFSYLTYRRALKKQKNVSKTEAKKVYGEIFKLNTDPRLLITGHLIVEFEKEHELEQLFSTIHNKYKDTNITAT